MKDQKFLMKTKKKVNPKKRFFIDDFVTTKKSKIEGLRK